MEYVTEMTNNLVVARGGLPELSCDVEDQFMSTTLIEFVGHPSRLFQVLRSGFRQGASPSPPPAGESRRAHPSLLFFKLGFSASDSFPLYLNAFELYLTALPLLPDTFGIKITPSFRDAFGSRLEAELEGGESEMLGHCRRTSYQQLQSR